MNDLFKSKIQNFAGSCSLRRSCTTAVISNRPTGGVFNLPVIDIPPFPSHNDTSQPCHSDEKQKEDCIILAKRVYFVIVGSILLGIIVLCLLVAYPCSIVGSVCHPNATCVNNWLKVSCQCRPEYVGDGVNFCDECGRVNSSSLQGAIEASRSSIALIYFSYKANIITAKTNQTYEFYSIVCSGTLIGRDTILTAGRCIQTKFRTSFNNTEYLLEIRPNFYYPTLESMYTVLLGTHDSNPVYPKSYSVRKIILPVEFMAANNNKRSDIVLFKLSQSVKIGQYMKPACLPGRELITSKTTWIIGYNNYDRQLSTRQDIVIKDDATCESAFSRQKFNSSMQLCASDVTGKRGTCGRVPGDSLLLLKKIREQWTFVIVGVFSYPKECDKYNKLGVFTRIDYFHQWITDRV